MLDLLWFNIPFSINKLSSFDKSKLKFVAGIISSSRNNALLKNILKNFSMCHNPSSKVFTFNFQLATRVPLPQAQHYSSLNLKPTHTWQMEENSNLNCFCSRHRPRRFTKVFRVIVRISRYSANTEYLLFNMVYNTWRLLSHTSLVHFNMNALQPDKDILL